MATEAEKIEDGGPAYPRIQQFVDSFGHMKQVHDGMSLRDWFAGQALSGFMANTKRPTTFARDDADWAYTIADAMIQARKVGVK